MNARHSARGLEISFGSRPFCIGLVLCTRGHHSSGDKSRKITEKIHQTLMIRKAQVNGEVDLLISIPFIIVKTIYLSTVEPRLSGLGGTWVNSPDNRESG